MVPVKEFDIQMAPLGTCLWSRMPWISRNTAIAGPSPLMHLPVEILKERDIDTQTPRFSTWEKSFLLFPCHNNYSPSAFSTGLMSGFHCANHTIAHLKKLPNHSKYKMLLLWSTTSRFKRPNSQRASTVKMFCHNLNLQTWSLPIFEILQVEYCSSLLLSALTSEDGTTDLTT